VARAYWPRFPMRCPPVPEFGPPTAVICAGCGLLCDDVIVERSGDNVRLQPDCALGAGWFSERAGRHEARLPAATVGGEPADLETALSRAAELLRGARRPLLFGFDGATVEDARAAVALADRLGALVAADGVGAAWPGAAAVPLRGASTATLGEIRERSGVVVIWREDPETSHPRLLDRLGFNGAARSHGGHERTLVVVDDCDTATSQRADLQLRWGPERDLEALTGLHVLQRRLALRPSGLEAELGDLLERLTAVPHAAFVHGPALTAGAGGQRRALALHGLVRELCLDGHVVTLALPASAGVRGAQDVLAWQTGYAENIDLGSGHPELVTSTSPLATGDGVDVSLCVEGDPGTLPDGATGIALCSRPVTGVEVSIRTAAAGVEAGGTAHRLDGVPLTLQAPMPGDAPTAAVLMGRLLAEIGR
jgi:formylmethanofuran dehydrogenase subunit B